MHVMTSCKYSSSANNTTCIDKINSNNSINNADNDDNKYICIIYIYINNIYTKVDYSKKPP